MKLRLFLLTFLWCGFFSYRVNATTLPTTLGWFEIPSSQIRPNCFTPTPAGNEGCAAVTADWAGAVYDSTRNRMLITGGGHQGYAGNEVYVFDLNTLTMTRGRDPSTGWCPINDCPCDTARNHIMPDGQPDAWHSYDGWVYMPNVDKVYRYGAGAFPCGGMGNDTFLMNPTTFLWTQVFPTGDVFGQTLPFNVGAVYDDVSGKVFVRDDHYLFSYDPIANSYTRFGADLGMSNNKSTFLDTKRRQYVMIVETGYQRAGMWYYKLDGSDVYALNTFSFSGTDPLSIHAVGVTYDPVRDKAYAWKDGNAFYELDMTTHVWSQISAYSGGPTGMANGPFGRWRYIPKLGVVIGVNSVDDNAYALRLAPPEDTDFYNRCHAPGVVRCFGWDSASLTPTAGDSSTDGYAGSSPLSTIAIDTGSNCASGDPITGFRGCFEQILSTSVPGDNPSVDYLLHMYPGTANGFGQNQTFYVQWRQKFDSVYTAWPTAFGGGGMKSVALYDYREGTYSAAAIWTFNDRFFSFPSLFTNYGVDTADPLGNLSEFSSGGFTINEWTLPYPPNNVDGVGQTFWCIRQHADDVPPGERATNKCNWYPTGTWWTFYYKIQIGTWGQPNSVVQAQTALPGENYVTFEYRTQKVLSADTPATTKYNSLRFSSYDTGRGADPDQAHDDGHTWYDEAIISTQPIAAPGFAATIESPPVVQLNAPTGLSVTP